MNPQFAKAVEAAAAIFDTLADIQPLTLNELRILSDRAGVYVMYDQDRPAYVGRTRNVYARIRGHRSDSHFSATYALRLARKDWHDKHSPEQRHATTKLLGQPEFETFRTIRQKYVADLLIRFMPCTDTLEQYLLEAYTIVALNLPRDELRTH